MIKIEIKRDEKCSIQLSGPMSEVIAEFATMTEQVRESIEEHDSEDVFKVAVLSALFDAPIEDVHKMYKKIWKGSKGGDSK